MKRISKKNHIHKMSQANEPCIKVESGERLIVETWDALEGRSREYFENKTPYPEIFPNANPATGPIYINDALPGDALEIEIHDIALSGYGFMTLRKNRFLKEGPKDEVVYIQVETQEEQLLYEGRRLTLEPMIGVIGTAPKEEMWCQETGAHGANMDAKIIKKGAKVLLPVFVEGALLAMGDVHAVMGDGEVFGQGIEIGAEIEITVRVRKDIVLNRPMVIMEDGIACISSNSDMEIAKDQVIHDMGVYLIKKLGFSPLDASAIIAFYGELRFCQVVNPQMTLRMELKNKYIDMFLNN